MALNKDHSIICLLNDLDLSSRDWMVDDDWEADLCAIGIAHKNNPDRVVYISTFGQHENRFFFDCDERVSDDDWRTVVSGSDVSLADLIRAIEMHLDA